MITYHPITVSLQEHAEKQRKSVIMLMLLSISLNNSGSVLFPRLVTLRIGKQKEGHNKG